MRKSIKIGIITTCVVSCVAISCTVFVGIAKQKAADMIVDKAVAHVISESMKTEMKNMADAESIQGDANTSSLSEHAIEQKASHTPEEVEEYVQQVMDEIDDDDKQELSNIIENHMDMEDVSTLIETYQEGDYDKLKDEAEKMLTEEEMQSLTDMYEKYSYLLE